MNGSSDARELLIICQPQQMIEADLSQVLFYHEPGDKLTYLDEGQIKLEPEFRIMLQDMDMEPDPEYIPQELHHFTRYRCYVSKKTHKNCLKSSTL